jgi:tRNA-Thr(GGU) m(6)t(6)A37 methyltransferase TsaA
VKEIKYHAIGVIRSPFKHPQGMPIQPSAAKGVIGSIEIAPKYVDGLRHIQGFSHIILLYDFHLSKGYSLKVTPFLDNHSHGVFATRAPRRPNAIGLSVVRLMRANGRILHIRDLDILDGTPLLDIKPYVPMFDVHRVDRIGWLAKKRAMISARKADERFT